MRLNFYWKKFRVNFLYFNRFLPHEKSNFFNHDRRKYFFNSRCQNISRFSHHNIKKNEMGMMGSIVDFHRTRWVYIFTKCFLYREAFLKKCEVLEMSGSEMFSGLRKRVWQEDFVDEFLSYALSSMRRIFFYFRLKWWIQSVWVPLDEKHLKVWDFHKSFYRNCKA